MSMQGAWRIIEMGDASGEISIDFDPDGALNSETCLSDGDESEFRAVPRDSSTAC